MSIALAGCLMVSPVADDLERPLYDVVIRNGRVLDGAGNPWVAADIAIKNGRFTKIGLVADRGAREIEAAGLYVSPGWIDMMDQSGEGLLESGFAYNKIAMGVTSLVAGEMGAPVPAGEIADYFSQLESQGLSLNFGTYYSATQARTAIFGESAGQPTRTQLDEMKKLVAEAMEAGALGITTALIYPPSSYQGTDELIALAQIVARYGGIYASHIRDESLRLVEAVEEAIRIGEESGAPVEIFHLKAAYAPGWGKLMKEALTLIDAARGRGVDIAANLYPYQAGGTGLDVSVPSWVFADGREIAAQRLTDPQVRQRMKRELATGPQPGWTNIVYASGGWENVVLGNSAESEMAHFEGMRMSDIGEALGKDPADVAWDLILAAYPEHAQALYFFVSEADIETAIRRPWVSIGSDAAIAVEPGAVDVLGIPHPRSYGTFPKIIAQYVREKGVLTLPDAVRKMTSWPATRMGFSKRGLIRVGLAADVTIFDFESIEDRATWEQPTLLPTGIEYVLVNGEVVLDQGEHTGAMPGVILRGAGAHIVSPASNN